MTNAVVRRLGALALLLAGAAALIVLPAADLSKQVARFVEWVRSLGPWGPAALALAYVPACLVFFPGSVLTLSAGFLFGVPVGTAAVSAGSVAGAAAAFWVGRSLARGWVEGKVAGNPRFRALDGAVASSGFKIVFLTRLSPVLPFTVLNYAFGLTRVRFRDYLLASWVGMLPGTIMYVYLGSAARSLGDVVDGRVEGGAGQQALFWGGLAATVVVTVFVTRLARNALRAAVPPEEVNRA